MTLRTWQVRDRILGGHELPIIAGIVNVTPDSFFDGGQHADTDAAIAHGLKLHAEGADQLDVGGESTRFGAATVPLDEELRRVIPVIRALANEGCAVAVDTRHPEVAEAALEAGAGAINDIEGLRDPRMIGLCARYQAGAGALHMRGTPRDMQKRTDYGNVLTEVGQFLSEALERWLAAGLPAGAFAPDPGIGYGKTVEHSQTLVAATADFRRKFPECPWYLGMSRKSFIGGTAGVAPGSDRLAGSLGAAVTAFLAGCDILRVHDVAATREALLLAAACRERSA